MQPQSSHSPRLAPRAEDIRAQALIVAFVSGLRNVDTVAWAKVGTDLHRWRLTASIHATLGVTFSDGSSLKAWVDSCSPISLVGASFLQKFPSLRVHDVHHHRIFKGLGKTGEKLEFQGVVIFNITVGEVEMQVIAAVLKDELPPGCGLLLGRYDFEANDLGVSIYHTQVRLWRGGNQQDIVALTSVEDWIAALPPSLDPIPAPLAEEHELVLEQDKILTAAGEYYIQLRVSKEWIMRQSTGVGAGALVVAVEQYLPWNVVVRDRWGILHDTLMDITSGIARLKLTKIDDECTLLKKGLILGVIEEVFSPENQQLIVLKNREEKAKNIIIPPFFSKKGTKLAKVWVGASNDVQKRPLSSLDKDLITQSSIPKGAKRSRPWLSAARELWANISKQEQDWIQLQSPIVIAGLVGQTSDALKEVTASSKSLADVSIKDQMTKLAKKTIQQWQLLSTADQDALTISSIAKRQEGKNFKLEPLPPELMRPPNTVASSSFPGAVPWSPDSTVAHPEYSHHDGEILHESAANMAIGGGKLPEMSALEFFVSVGCPRFFHHGGSPLIDFPKLFLQSVSNVFRYREAGLFRQNYNKPLPKIGGVKYQVVMKAGEEKNPFDSGRRKYSDAESAEICRQVMQLIQSGVLSPTRSAWSSSLVLVSKNGGGIRMCVDLRGINNRTLHVASQLPLIADVLQDSFLNSDITFSQLDLSQAYHQLEVTEDSREFLAFKLPRVSAEECKKLGFNPPFQVTWNRVPFGLSDAVTSFSNLVMSIFQPAGFSPYLDDLGLGAISTESMSVQLEQIFSLAAAHGLTFGAKCTMYAKQIGFLGHIISSKGISLDPSRIEGILNTPEPTSIDTLRSFLGIVGFCQQFCGLNFSAIATPLTDLLRDPTRKHFGWKQEHSLAVSKIKEALTSAPTLRIFDNTLETCVVTDGSAKGVGAVLMQRHQDKWLPVFYLSKKLSEVQSRWNTTHFELFGVILALEKWKRFLIGKQFTVVTDHEALKYLRQPKLFTGRRLTRWQMMLSEYQFSTVHKAGKDLGLVDFLSRSPQETVNEKEDEDTSDISTCEETLIGFISTLELSSSTRETTAVCHSSSVPSLIAIIATLHTSTTALVFKKGDRVSTVNASWGLVHGSLQTKSKKGSKKGQEWWTVRFDATPSSNFQEETWQVEKGDLTLLDAVPVEESPSDRLTRGASDIPQNDSDGSSKGGIEGDCVLTPQHEFEGELPEEEAHWGIGDTVKVAIGHTLAFRPAQSVMLPLGTIKEISASSIIVQLKLEGRPLHIIDKALAKKWLTLVISQEKLLMIKAHNKNVAYDVGDIVTVVRPRVHKEINAHLLRLEVIKQEEKHLVGIIMCKTKTKDEYDVHFGSLENGVFALVQTDMALLACGDIPALAAINLGKLPSMSGLDTLPKGSSLLTSLRKPSTNISEAWLLEVQQEQRKDPMWYPIIEYLEHGKISSVLSDALIKKQDRLSSIYCLLGNVLYTREQDKSNKLVIPSTLIPTACFLVHDAQQHFDWNRSNEYAGRYFHIRGRAEIIRRYVGSCYTCQRTRNYSFWTKQYGTEVAERVQHFKRARHWAVDLKKIPQDKHGYNYLMVLIDLCTRFVVAIPLKSKEKLIVGKAIYDNLISKFGNGDLELLYDQGSEFMNEYLTMLTTDYFIIVSPVQVRHAQGNGMVERFMQTFNIHFAKAMTEKVLDPVIWSEWLIQLVALYNGLYNAVVGNSPYYLMYLNDFTLNSAQALLNTSSAVGSKLPMHKYNSPVSSMESSLALLASNQVKLLQVLKSKFQRHAGNVEMARAFTDHVPHFDIGSEVLVLLGDSNGGYLFKNRAHAGPFRIHSQSSSTTYIIYGNDHKLVSIHGYKLLTYEMSLADMLGNHGLAHSAVGAAAARLLYFDSLHEVHE